MIFKPLYFKLKLSFFSLSKHFLNKKVIFGHFPEKNKVIFAIFWKKKKKKIGIFSYTWYQKKISWLIPIPNSILLFTSK